jgi:hypothetical protein
MTAQHLKGRIFHREGVNYLVMDDNDWKADILNVRSINAKRRCTTYPKQRSSAVLATRLPAHPDLVRIRQAQSHPL